MIGPNRESGLVQNMNHRGIGDAIRDAWIDIDAISGIDHWHDCYRVHVGCAVGILLDIIDDLCSDTSGEIERLRALITAWADADDGVDGVYALEDLHILESAWITLGVAKHALRAEVGR